MSLYPEQIHVRAKDIINKKGTYGIPTYIHINPWFAEQQNEPLYYHESTVEDLESELENLKTANLDLINENAKLDKFANDVFNQIELYVSFNITDKRALGNILELTKNFGKELKR